MSTREAYYGLKKNVAIILYTQLAHPTDADVWVADPTLASGDVRVSVDGGAFGNLTTLPVVTPAGEVGVKITISQTEMNGDNILITFKDQTASEEWQAHCIAIRTTAADIDDTYTRVGAPAGASVSADVAAIKSETAAIVADTNEVQGDLTNGGRLDLLIDSILADTGELQTDWTNGGRLDLLLDATLADTAELQTDLTNGGRIDLLIDAILADTNELQGDWANNGRLDLLIDAILADTNEVQTDLVNGGRLDLLIDAILADTGELQTDWVNGGRLDLLLDATVADAAAILDDTGTAGVKINMAQTYSEGQTERTLGGSLEITEAFHRNPLLDEPGEGGERTIYRADGTTVIKARTRDENDRLA